MEDWRYHYHESGESVDVGRHGKEFESDFGKFLLLQIFCQRENFKKFRMTREKKGTGKFDDFLLVYDACDDTTKYRLFQLKHFSDKNKKIKYDDLVMSSKSFCGLPYYYDHYNESLKYLSNDKDLKDAELEELVFCTNIDIGEDLGFICKAEVPNEGLMKHSGRLFKLSINDEGIRRGIFHEQFFSERKRLANELARLIMQNSEKKEINIQSMISSDLFSLIKTFYEMIVEYVVDIETNEFKESFLDANLEHQNQELYEFRNEFFESLSEVHLKNEQLTNNIKSKKFKSLSFEMNNTEEIVKYLKKQKVKIIGIPDINRILSEKLILSMMFQKPIDLKSILHSPKSLHKVSKLIMEHVVDLNSMKLKESFLNDTFVHSEDLATFRKCFFKVLKIFHKEIENKDDRDLVKLFNILNPCSANPDSQFSFRMALTNFKLGGEKMDDVLKSNKIIFKEFPDNSGIDIFPSGCVDTSQVHENILKFLNLLIFAVNQDNIDDLIFKQIQTLITKGDDKAVINKTFNRFMNTWHNECISNFVLFESKLKFRKWITEKELMENIENSVILFQNKEVKFIDVCSACEACSPDLILYTLTENRTLSLGKKIDQDPATFYIHRVLNQNKRISCDILLEQSQDLIVIITLDERFNPKDLEKLFSLTIELKDLQSFDGNYQHFYTKEEYSFKHLAEFCNTNRKFISKRTVHWITYLGSDFRYESSHSDSIKSPGQQNVDNEASNESDLIKKFQTNNPVTESELIKNENFVIVTGAPGGGKSVLLKRLSYEIKILNLLNWVIFISLNKYKRLFDEYENLENVDDIIDFLSKVENAENDFSRRILRHHLYNGRLILLFDGFDELHESSRQEKFLRLLQFLKRENYSKQIFITSRPHCVKQIENVLGVVAFEVEDISEDDQIKLVIELWKDENSWVSLIEERAEEFVQNFNDDFSTTEKEFLGIPLQTYMFAIAYKNKALQTPSISYQSVNLVQLFDDFISSKYDIFFSEKINIDRFLQKDNKNNYEIRHQKFALKHSDIIPFEFAETLKINSFVRECSDEDTETIKEIGLIYATNNVYEFVHETFAEYYIADLLIISIEDRKDENIIEVVKCILMEAENDFILHVFDTHLTFNSKEYEIQNSIINGREEFVICLNKEALTKVDPLGRNLFYYALQDEQFVILSHLIENEVELSFEPFFGNRLIDFASDFFENQEIDFKEELVENEDESLEYEKIYVVLFEYILEKENKDGMFGKEFLDQCLRLENEISYRHWGIATKLITKFDKEVYHSFSYIRLFSDAPKYFLCAFAKLLDKEKDWLNILNNLLNLEPKNLKEMIERCNYFFLKIPVCRELLDHSDEEYFSYTNFSGFINSLIKSIENFNILFKFLFESKDVSFEEFNKMFNEKLSLPRGISTIQDGNYHIIMPFNLCNYTNPIYELRSINPLQEEDQIILDDFENTLQKYKHILHYDDNTSIKEAAKKIVNHVLSSGDAEHVKHVYNKCCSFKTAEEASFYWEEAKRTELSEYYALPMSRNNKDKDTLLSSSRCLEEPLKHVSNRCFYLRFMGSAFTGREQNEQN